MNTPAKSAASEPALTQEWLRALRYWLGGRRGVIALAAFAVVAGAALNWSWLAATGVAPLLVAVLPCAVMCGLGLCMSRVMGGSCSGARDAADSAAPRGARPEALPAAAADPNRLTLGLDGLGPTVEPAATPVQTAAEGQPQPAEERVHV